MLGEKADLLKKLRCDFYDLKNQLDRLNEHLSCEGRMLIDTDKNKVFEYKSACKTMIEGLGMAMGGCDLRIRILNREGGDGVFNTFNHEPKKPKIEPTEKVEMLEAFE